MTDVGLPPAAGAPAPDARACASTNCSCRSFAASESLNMPSSFAVKADPHSVFRRLTMALSASTDAERPSSSRFARSFL